jgi:hypothetical protein
VLKKQVLYEEIIKYADEGDAEADKHAAAGFVEILSNEHLDNVLGSAGREGGGYVDAEGQTREPHKMVVVQVHANWCRACLGVRPRVAKLCARHPEVLLCRLNKGDHEVSTRLLG